MGTNNTPQVDAEYYKDIHFYLKILVCGNYDDKKIEVNLKDIENKNENYCKKAKHKYINEWEFFFFPDDNKVGKKTFDFIKLSKENNEHQILILFYSGSRIYNYTELLEFYEQQIDVYHPFFIIITKKEEKFILPKLSNLRNDYIREIIENDNNIELMINIIQIASYYNELGDEIGFPKQLIDKSLLEKDEELMVKDLFTLNFCVCGKPGAGKSTFINNILGEKKCFSGVGDSSLTKKIVKYIHRELPIVIYDTPGFLEPKDIDHVQKLIEEKNSILNEEKNQIHCLFYLLNIKGERTFSESEYIFLTKLLELKLDIYIILTHAEDKKTTERFCEIIKVELIKEGRDKKLKELEKKIYPTQLIDTDTCKRSGMKALFLALYEKYKNQILEDEITQYNINDIKNDFLKNMKTKNNVIEHSTALAIRVKTNFKILASSLGKTLFVRGSTNLSTGAMRIITKIYNQNITIENCLNFIEVNKYTNELVQSDTPMRKFEKFFAWKFYENGPAAREVNYLSDLLIKKYNKDLEINDIIFYNYLNVYRKSINISIESLKEINDEYKVNKI